MTREEFASQLNLEESIIPQGRKNRPGTLNVPKFITIHNTDNSKQGADARAHGRFLVKTGHYILNGKKHWVSWHYTVDDKRVVKHLPLKEKAFHAVSANGQSVGIEICMNEGIDQEKAFLNAARLTALLLFDLGALNRDVKKVVPHHFWTGKNCPRLLLDNGKVGAKWQNFLNTVQQELDTLTSGASDMASDDLLGLDVSNEAGDIELVRESGDFHIDESETSQEENASIPVEAELFSAVVQQAQKRGVNAETLINLWLQQKVNESPVEE